MVCWNSHEVYLYEIWGKIVRSWLHEIMACGIWEIKMTFDPESQCAAES